MFVLGWLPGTNLTAIPFETMKFGCSSSFELEAQTTSSVHILEPMA